MAHQATTHRRRGSAAVAPAITDPPAPRESDGAEGVLDARVRSRVEIFTPPTGLASAADPRAYGPQDIFKNVYFTEIKCTFFAKKVSGRTPGRPRRPPRRFQKCAFYLSKMHFFGFFWAPVRTWTPKTPPRRPKTPPRRPQDSPRQIGRAHV